MNDLAVLLAELKAANNSGNFFTLEDLKDAARTLSIDLPEGSTQLAYSGGSIRAYLFPRCLGLTEIEPHIYLEQTDDAMRTQIRADVFQARRVAPGFLDGQA